MLLLQAFLFIWLFLPAEALECFPLAIPLCQGFGYTTTSVPYEGQLAIQGKITELLGEVNGLSECTNYLRPFLCFTFSPKCRKKFDYGIRPCQSTCRFVERQCKHLISSFWPNDELDCEREFLVRRRGVQCLSTAKLKGLSKTTGAKPEKRSTTTTIPGTTGQVTSEQTIVTTAASKTVGKPTTSVPTAAAEVSTRDAKSINILTTTAAPRQASVVIQNVTKSGWIAKHKYRKTSLSSTTYLVSTTTPPVSTTTPPVSTTTPPVSTTTPPVSTTTPLVSTLSAIQPTALTTNTPIVNYTGPIFNPFYPPTFGKFEDPRKRTTPTPVATSTATSLGTTTDSDLNMTSAEPWYKKVQVDWLVQQVNSSIQAGNGERDYTKDWDLTAYAAYLDELEAQAKTEPWYKQEYNDIISDIDVKSIEWKAIPKNGSLVDIPSIEEREKLFAKVFGLDDNSQPQADSADSSESSEGVIYPIFADSAETEVDINKTMEELDRVLNELALKYYSD